MTTLSIALATYNGMAHLPAQLESIGAQGRPPDELVVCDDRSNDGTPELVADFAAGASFPVHLSVNEARLGFAENFLRAATRCTSDLIAFCDQDDVWRTDKLGACAAAFEDPRVGLVVHSADVVDGRLRPAGRRHPRLGGTRTVAPHASSPWLDAPGFAMVFRRQLLHPALIDARPRSRYDDERLHHDEWIWLWARLIAHARFIDRPLVSYRQHGENSAGAPDVGVKHMVGMALHTGRPTYEAFAELAAGYADFLRAAATAMPERRVELECGAALYASIAGHARLRAQLYDRGVSLSGRARRVVRLARHGAYRSPARGGMGWRSALKDATVGLLTRSSASSPVRPR
jgi:glycosyltransferase involved in cell wall biosynthesis